MLFPGSQTYKTGATLRFSRSRSACNSTCRKARLKGQRAETTRTGWRYNRCLLVMAENVEKLNWLTLCRDRDLPKRGVRCFNADVPSRTRILLLRSALGIQAYINSCPHTGVPLDWTPGVFMNRDDTYLQCATHGALFIPETGKCVAGPCKDAFLTRIRVRLYGDEVQVEIGTASPERT